MERNYFFYISVFFTIAIAVGSLVSLKNTAVTSIHISDKLIHTSSYLILSASWMLGFNRIKKHIKYDVLICFLIFIFGIIIEVLQGVFTMYRQADLFDIIANFVGISTAFILFNYTFIKKWRN